MQRAVDRVSDLGSHMCTFASLIGHGFYHHYTTPNTGPDSPSQLSSNYSYASFGRSGVYFWLISSNDRISDSVNIISIYAIGYSNVSRVFGSHSLRPTSHFIPPLPTLPNCVADPHYIPLQLSYNMQKAAKQGSSKSAQISQYLL